MKETDVKERILETARRLFVENGYKGTSIRDIAVAADVNVAMVNYYFRSKQGLFEIIFDESASKLLNKIFSIIGSDLPFSELLDSWVSSYFEMLMANPHLPIFVLNEMHHNPEHLLKLVNKQNPTKTLEKLRERIQEEIQRGNIKEVPVMNLLLSVLSLCLFPFILGGILTQVTGERPEEYYAILENHKKFVVQFITDAIKA